MTVVSYSMPVDYFTKNDLWIERINQQNDAAKRLSLFLAVLDLCKLTADCSDIEKAIIVSTVKRKKWMIRRGCDPDE